MSLRFLSVFALIFALSFLSSLPSAQADVDPALVRTDSCNINDNNVDQMEVACVACAIKEHTATPENPDGITPSLKWLALLGLTTQQYYPNRDTQGSVANRDNFYRHMAQLIQAFGVCEEGQYGEAYKLGTGANIVEAKHVYSSETLASEDKMDSYAREFGFKGQKEMKKFFDFPTDLWDNASPKVRRNTFLDNVKKVKLFDEGTKGNQLLGCIKRIKDIFAAKVGLFDITAPGATKGTTNEPTQLGPSAGGASKTQTDENKNKANNQPVKQVPKVTGSMLLCQSIAASCGVSDASFCFGKDMLKQTAKPTTNSGSQSGSSSSDSGFLGLPKAGSGGSPGVDGANP